MVDAVCIHAYNSNDPNVHNLNVDDQLVVIPVNEDWCRAKLNDVEAFAPLPYLRLEPHDWYKGKIHHDVASTLLFEKDINGECIQDDGAFLVRDNLNTPGFFSLTIKWKNSSQKYRIYYENKKFKIWDECFTSINKLIKYHEKNSINQSETILLKGFKNMPRYKAIADFTARDENELSFKSGDILRILDNREPVLWNPLWWKAENNYQYGLVPAQYLDKID